MSLPLMMLMLMLFGMVVERKKLSPPHIARMYGVSTGKVIGWIKSGQLIAIDVADGPKHRPRYLVDLDDLKAFEADRRVVKIDDSGSTTPLRKLRQRGPAIKEFV